MTIIKFNLFALKRKLELHRNKSYTWREIAHATGVHFNTLYNMANNKTGGIDLKILAKLFDYFRGEGLDINPLDLFLFDDTNLHPVRTAAAEAARRDAGE